MFMHQLRRIVNTGQARSIILTGNINDLFFGEESYVPLIDYLAIQTKVNPTADTKGITRIIWKLNNAPVVQGDMEELEQVWRIVQPHETLANRLDECVANTTFALELLRRLTEYMRKHSKRNNNLLIIIEAADILVPDTEISRMSLSDRKRLAILHDWFSDPAFLNGGDTVILLSESRSSIHHKIARLPQVVSIDVPLPNLETRRCFVQHFSAYHPNLDLGALNVPAQSAGLSCHALRQYLLGGDYSDDALTGKVEEYMVAQLGDGVIEFKRPSHTMEDVIGASRVKAFMRNELIPGFKDGSIGGAAVGGPIGGGKTFICEAMAAELGIPVIVLKNIRSKWFGETDKIFERLRRLLEQFHQIVIFVDEADTQFGAIEGGHETERRLTGKIQAMMSDVALRGKVIWFLMTARIHLLSPDIRRPGRMDLIIPILDPEGDDRKEFIRWCFDSVEYEGDTPLEDLEEINAVTEGYSAAAFAMLRARIKSKVRFVHKYDGLKIATAIARDMVLPDIADTRNYQTLQAKVNCTRKSLLFDPESSDYTDNFDTIRETWHSNIAALEARGIR